MFIKFRKNHFQILPVVERLV